MKKTKVKHSMRNDIILIVSLLAVAAIGILYLFVFRGRGDTVKVTVNGEIYGTYSLSENITQDICTGENGEFHNRLVICDGKADIQAATCPDGICVDHPPIFREGESIVCLPQRVVITVIFDNPADNPDVIV